MARTIHIRKRMSQRGIRQELIDLVMRFGTKWGDKVILNRKGATAAINELDFLRAKLLKALDKGGVVVVEENGSLITTYNLDSYNSY